MWSGRGTGRCMTLGKPVCPRMTCSMPYRIACFQFPEILYLFGPFTLQVFPHLLIMFWYVPNSPLFCSVPPSYPGGGSRPNSPLPNCVSFGYNAGIRSPATHKWSVHRRPQPAFCPFRSGAYGSLVRVFARTRDISRRLGVHRPPIRRARAVGTVFEGRHVPPTAGAARPNGVRRFAAGGSPVHRVSHGARWSPRGVALVGRAIAAPHAPSPLPNPGDGPPVRPTGLSSRERQGAVLAGTPSAMPYPP